MQSPIRINDAKTFDEDYANELVLSDYRNGMLTGTLENNGHVLVLEPSTTPTQSLNGGLLPNVYDLSHVEFHWGSTNNQGSEHIINDQEFAMELHFIHFNSKYPTLSDALSSGNHDSVAVLAVMVEMTDDANTAFDVRIYFNF